ncbi:MAG: single-stranded DNA-binding protein [Acholeplasmatales bacterium]|nr:single-stranded DNA-binding protein [Acholeplasmatales bacterium]
MYNYFMLIGTIYKDFEIKEVKDGIRVVSIPLVVRREFQNSNGEYDADFFTVTVWESLAQIAVDNLKKGTKIGLKGRIRPKLITIESGAKIVSNQLVADRLIYFGRDELDNYYQEERENKQESEITASEDIVYEDADKPQVSTKKSAKKAKEVKD